MPGGRALIVGGTGQIGRAVAERLLGDAWDVTLAARHPERMPEDVRARGARFVRLDRREDGAVAAVVADGVDLLVDCVCFNPDEARQLLAIAGSVGHIVVISSASVYADDQGRDLDSTTNPESAPRLPQPIPETQRTVDPDGDSYSARKVAMERTLVEPGMDVTVLRPCAVHGPGSGLPREWHFVKRALDHRPIVILATRGEARFHTTSTPNVATLVEKVATLRGTRVLNCGDPKPPTVLEISRAIARVMEHQRDEVLLPGAPPSRQVGMSPWQTPWPFVVDMTAAESLGYRPVTDYASAVSATCRWLVGVTSGRDWREVLGDATGYLEPMLDYDAEDSFVGSGSVGG